MQQPFTIDYKGKETEVDLETFVFFNLEKEKPDLCSGESNDFSVHRAIARMMKLFLSKGVINEYEIRFIVDGTVCEQCCPNVKRNRTSTARSGSLD